MVIAPHDKPVMLYLPGVDIVVSFALTVACWPFDPRTASVNERG